MVAASLGVVASLAVGSDAAVLVSLVVGSVGLRGPVLVAALRISLLVGLPRVCVDV